ncbi:MAG: phytanoyl-CoA dioxygenase family protein, partial [Novosphingobium sp.]
LPDPVERIAKSLLGPDFMFDLVGLLMAFPGAGDQRHHADATLYPGTPLDGLLQPFALAFAQPLVEMNERSGRTAFWLRSHRKGSAEGPWDFAPVAGPGSALLWDFRTFHAGLANTSGQLRPVLYNVLCRHWWCEYLPPETALYEKLRVARDVYEDLDPRWRQRLRRARVVDPHPYGTPYADN